MPTVKNPAARLAAVQARIKAAAERFQRRPDSILLLAASKAQSADAVAALAVAGQQRFGENYLQEALDKMQATSVLEPRRQLEWHFIGPVQTNKTRRIAEQFAWVHSVDRYKIAQRLSEQRPPSLEPLNICLQVNISEETSKHGLPLSELATVAQAVAALPRLRLRGLMAVPAPSEDFAEQRQAFAAVRQAQEALNRSASLGLDTLSLGMSADLEAAIAEGSTLVRVGTALFGPRPSKAKLD